MARTGFITPRLRPLSFAAMVASDVNGGFTPNPYFEGKISCRTCQILAFWSALFSDQPNSWFVRRLKSTIFIGEQIQWLITNKIRPWRSWFVVPSKAFLFFPSFGSFPLLTICGSRGLPDPSDGSTADVGVASSPWRKRALPIQIYRTWLVEVGKFDRNDQFFKSFCSPPIFSTRAVEKNDHQKLPQFSGHAPFLSWSLFAYWSSS